MRFTMHLITLLCLWSAFAYAGTWPGTLVDSKCFAIAELNVNSNDTSTYVDSRSESGTPHLLPGSKDKVFRSCSARWTQLDSGFRRKRQSGRNCVENRQKVLIATSS